MLWVTDCHSLNNVNEFSMNGGRWIGGSGKSGVSNKSGGSGGFWVSVFTLDVSTSVANNRTDLSN